MNHKLGIKNCDEPKKDYVGTHRCKCKRGFEDKGMGFKGDCVDIDECKTGNNKCVGANVMCKNLPGGYKCPCKPGFAGDMRRGCKGKLNTHTRDERTRVSEVCPCPTPFISDSHYPLA